MDYEVEKNVPLPNKSAMGRTRKYPFAEMKETESFIIEGCTRDQATTCRNSGNDYYKRRDMPLKVASKKEENGYRFWVIKK